MLHTHEATGSSPVVSTKTPENALFSGVLLCSAACAHAFPRKKEEGRRTGFRRKGRFFVRSRAETKEPSPLSFSDFLNTDGVVLVGVGIKIVPKCDKASADFASIVSVHRLPLRCWDASIVA